MWQHVPGCLHEHVSSGALCLPSSLKVLNPRCYRKRIIVPIGSLPCMNINDRTWVTDDMVIFVLVKIFLVSSLILITWFFRLTRSFRWTSLSSYTPKKVLSTLCKIPSCSLHLILKNLCLPSHSWRSHWHPTLHRQLSRARLWCLKVDLYILFSWCCRRSIWLDIGRFYQDCWIARLLYPPFF